MNTNSFSNVSATSHMDYRYFFMNNKNYYDELSTMSLMLCNAFENPNTNELNNINTLFDRIGMNDNFLNETATIGSDYKKNIRDGVYYC